MNYLKTSKVLLLCLLFTIPALADEYRDADPTLHPPSTYPVSSTDEVWDLLGEVPFPQPYHFGAEFLNGSYYTVSGNYLYEVAANGTIIDSVICEGATTGFTVRDMATDGTYLYGSWDATLRAFDPVTGLNVPAFNIPLAATGLTLGRGVAYDPVEDVFYVTNWSTVTSIYKINRTGTVVSTLTNHNGVGGLAWWPNEPDGYKLFAYSQTSQQPTQIFKINPVTNATIQISTHLPNTGSDISGGAFITNLAIPGKWVLGAVIQSDPDRAMLYELADFSNNGVANGSVSPMYLNVGTNATFHVLYTNSGGTAPTGAFVSIDGSEYPMTAGVGSPATGQWYDYSTTVLTAGTHQYFFRFTVGAETYRYPVGTGTISGPNVYTNGMTGTKTIGGTNPDFPDFISAIDALALVGVGTGGITFNVRPGTYNERVIVYEVAGASDTNPIVFQAEGDAVTVVANGTSATGEWAIRFYGCDYVTFDGINVLEQGTGTTINEYGYWVSNFSATNGATNNTIKNATITMFRGNTATRGVFSSHAVTATAATGSNSNNKYLNLKISGPAYGMFLNGNTTWRDQSTEVGSTSSDLTFPGRFEVGAGGVDDIGAGAFAAYGLAFQYQENLTVHNVDVHNVSTIGVSGAYSAYGIYNSSFYGTANIYGNRISDIQSRTAYTSNGTAYGIYLSGASASTARVYNNFVWGMTSSAVRTAAIATNYAYGIYTLGSSTNYFIDFNSILINSGTINPATDLLYSSSCMYFSSGIVTARNNILYNKTAEQTGVAKHYGMYRSSATLTSNYNCFYIPNATNGYVGYYTTDRASLADWQSALAGMDAVSQYGNPRYQDDTGTDLHITINVATPVNNAGTPVAWAISDIENTARDVIPDIGADEGIFGITDPCAPSDLVILESYTNGLRVQWQGTCDTDSLYRFDISTDGTNFTTHSTVLSAGGAAPRTQATDLMGLLPAVQYYVRVYSMSTSNEYSTTIVQVIGNTLPVTAGAVYVSLTGGGFSTVKVDSIGVDDNPASVNYRVRDLITGNYVTVGSVLGATPRTASRASWIDFAVTGLQNGTQYQFVAIPVNNGGGTGAQGPTFNLTTNAFLATGGPDSSGYIFRTSAAVNGPVYGWVDPGTTAAVLSGDESSVWINFGGFHFPFYGQVYDSVNATTNCYLQFVAAGLQFANAAIPASSVAAPTMFPLWDDANLLTTNLVTYRNVGDGRFVITYSNIPHYDDNSALATFQVVLYEDGRILFQYQSVASFWTASIGIQGTGLTGSTNGLMFGEPNIFPATQSAILFYPFTPAAPNPPVVSISRINADIVLNWTPSTGGQLHGYKIYSSATPYFSIEGLTPVGTVDAATNTWTDFLAYETGIRYYLVTGYNNFTADSYRPFANEPLRFETSFQRGTGQTTSKKIYSPVRSID